MTREQFLQSLRRLAKKRNARFEVDRKKGAGSHYRVRFGEEVTTVQDKLNPSRIARIMKQLKLDPADL